MVLCSPITELVLNTLKGDELSIIINLAPRRYTLSGLILIIIVYLSVPRSLMAQEARHHAIYTLIRRNIIPHMGRSSQPSCCDDCL